MAFIGQNLTKISASRTSCLDSHPARVLGPFHDGRIGIRKKRRPNQVLQATPVSAGLGVSEVRRFTSTPSE